MIEGTQNRFEEIEEDKTDLMQDKIIYNNLLKHCDKLIAYYNKQNIGDCYLNLRKYLMENLIPIDYDFIKIYKSISLKRLDKYFNTEIKYIKDFAQIRICQIEEDIEFLDEERMRIDSSIFPGFYKNPKEDVEYLKTKKMAEKKRDQVFNEFGKNY